VTVDLAFAPSPVGVSDLRKLGEGRQAELFLWPGGVVKLFRSASDSDFARLEAATMSAVQATGIPMPHLLGTVMIEQRPGIVMQRLEGSDQLSQLGRQPWTIWSVATNLARLHAHIHGVEAPRCLLPLRASLRHEIENSARVPVDCKQRALAVLDRLPDGDVVCHWDFHPANVIETPSGPRAIDWAIVRRGHWLADVARTSQILRGGSLPPGAPFIVRTLTAVGRAVLHWRYLKEYRRLRPFDDSDLRPWFTVSAASRLTHGIAEERDQLVAVVRNSR
jgi:thiamine kinase